MKKIYTLSCALALYCLSMAQTTTTLTADMDNTIYSESINNSNGAGQNFFAGRTKDAFTRRALLHFNLSGIPANATVSSVTITLYNNKQAANSAGIVLNKLSNSWGEGTSDAAGNEGSGISGQTGDATWTRRMLPSTNWTTPGGDYVSTASASVATVSSGAVNVTGGTLVADVQSFVNNPAVNYGWIIRGSNETAAENTLRFASRNNPTVAQRPVISVTYSVTLPITLKTFAVLLQKQDALLNWQTSAEINTSHFNVEYSNNNMRFTTIGRITASGNSTTTNSYSFTHKGIFEGRHYYRIASYDLDGSVRYSKVVPVSSKKEGGFGVYPNPAISVINISQSIPAGSIFSISSVTGQLIKQGELAANQLTIDDLAAGQYWLTIHFAKGETSRVAFMKK
jgi:hypothetical protein